MDRPLLFLIGCRASGKTSVAPVLAGRLGWDWVDADLALEAREGRTIHRTFEEEGESGFREREAELLQELCRRRQFVVATGGGVVLRPDNRERMRATGRVVWLSADADTLWRRLEADLTGLARRPTLTVGGRAEVEEVLRQRAPLYREMADLVVATAGRTPEQVADVILAHWRSCP